MKILALVSILVCSIAAFAADPAPQSQNRTWITNVTVISPENLFNIAPASVLIEEGRIARIERKVGINDMVGATVVSGKGKFLIPGLIDSHVHLASVPGMTSDQHEGHSEMVAAYFKQLPRSYLYYGYTTLVDLAVVDQPVLDEFRRAPLHPDLYDCGLSLPVANGYPMSFLPPATRFKRFPNFIYDPTQKESIPAEYAPGDHTPAADIAKVKGSGGICVKTYFERGFNGDWHLPVMSAEMFAQVRKAATESGLVLMLHANSFEAQKFGVEGNTDVLAHGMWHWDDADAKKTQLTPEITKVLDQVVQKKIGYQATIQVLEGERAYFDPEYLKMPAIPDVIPRQMLAWLNTSDGQWFKKELNEENAPDATLLAGYDNGPLRRVRLVVAYLASKDADFLFGTDTPSGPIYGNLPGLNGYLEMQQLHKAGLSLAQIFKASTINNAMKLKLDAQLGTIEPGKVANLLLLEKSPLESVDAYDTIDTIWIHGQLISRTSLSALSASQKN
jgi:imidazolonepropionase-like amidohydrolase